VYSEVTGTADGEYDVTLTELAVTATPAPTPDKARCV
jgi:hypothetical protein